MSDDKKERGGPSEKEVVLLGLLAEEPSHAYGLEQKIRERRMTEWTAIGFSSIYRVLETLEAQALIASELQQAGQGAARRVYELTAKGGEALVAGVQAYLSNATGPKHPFNVGLAFASHVDRDILKQLFEAREELVRGLVEQLALLTESHIGLLPPSAGVNSCGLARRQWLGPALLFEHLRGHARAEIAFLKQALELVDACRVDASDSGGGDSKAVSEVKS